MTKTTSLCQAGSSRLWLIDVQTRLLGAMREEDATRVVRQATILARVANLLNIPTTLSEQYPKGLGKTEEQLAGVIPANALMVEKTRFSCCGLPEYQRQLEAADRRQVVIAGIEAHVCVLQTALELAQRDHQVFVVEDAVCSRNPENTGNALARLRQAGVIVTNTESVIFEWLGDANHPQFKAASALIR